MSDNGTMTPQAQEELEYLIRMIYSTGDQEGLASGKVMKGENIGHSMAKALCVLKRGQDGAPPTAYKRVDFNTLFHCHNLLTEYNGVGPLPWMRVRIQDTGGQAVFCTF